MRLVFVAPLLASIAALSFSMAGCNDRGPAAGSGSRVRPPEPAAPAPAGSAERQAPPTKLAVAVPEAALPDAAERDPRVVLAWWKHALERRDFTGARRAWGQFGAASGQSAQAFAAAWDHYKIIDVTVGEGTQEGAAGSLFYRAPVMVTGLRQDGKPYHLAGAVTLRRVNDVDGATPEQLRWHIERSTLAP